MTEQDGNVLATSDRRSLCIEEALYEIMRQASYLPRYWTIRRTIEDAANSGLRESREDVT